MCQDSSTAGLLTWFLSKISKHSGESRIFVYLTARTSFCYCFSFSCSSLSLSLSAFTPNSLETLYVKNHIKIIASTRLIIMVFVFVLFLSF